MKVLNQHIDMISWTSKDGKVTPVRFRMDNEESPIIIRVGKIIETDRNKFAGSVTLNFLCSSIIRGTERLYELTYNCGNQQWLLKKM